MRIQFPGAMPIKSYRDPRHYVIPLLDTYNKMAMAMALKSCVEYTQSMNAGSSTRRLPLKIW